MVLFVNKMIYNLKGLSFGYVIKLIIRHGLVRQHDDFCCSGSPFTSLHLLFIQLFVVISITLLFLCKPFTEFPSFNVFPVTNCFSVPLFFSVQCFQYSWYEQWRNKNIENNHHVVTRNIFLNFFGSKHDEHT